MVWFVFAIILNSVDAVGMYYAIPIIGAMQYGSDDAHDRQECRNVRVSDGDGHEDVLDGRVLEDQASSRNQSDDGLGRDLHVYGPRAGRLFGIAALSSG